MPIKANRTGIILKPDCARVFFRPFELNNRERVLRIVARVTALSREEAEREAAGMLREFSVRHQKLPGFLLKRFEQVREYLMSDAPLSEAHKLLLGGYLTLEYSLEAAALFNPSIVPHPDQSNLPEGSLRFVMSLRATGEGHISSIVFRTGIVDGEGRISINQPTRFVTAADVHPNPSYEKRLFEQKLLELGLLNSFAQQLMDRLEAQFTYEQLSEMARQSLRRDRLHSADVQATAQGMMALAQTNYEISFEPSDHCSERVIFPVTQAEMRGIEDARFVAFREDDGSTHYYATYTAFDGQVTLPQLLETRDFVSFKINTLNGIGGPEQGHGAFSRARSTGSTRCFPGRTAKTCT